MLAAIKVQNKYGQSRAYIGGSACHTRSWTPVLKKKQARKLQDAQAEKLTSLQAEKLTC